MRPLVGTLLGLTLCAAGRPDPAAAQSTAAATIRSAYLEDLATLESKFTALAEAFPEAQFDWAPMEGVRSVRQVVGLLTAENTLMVARVFDKPLPASWTARDAAAVMAVGREQMLTNLRNSFAVARTLWGGLSDEEMTRTYNFYGTQMTGNAIAIMWLADEHEHLGQLIAYARMNRIVPPWSR